jgi:beta-glucanase (GH16 family)
VWYPAHCYRPVLVPEMNRRNVMLTFGIGALAAASPTPKASAYPSRPLPPPTAPVPGAQTGGYLFHDEFDGPAGSAPDPSKWAVSSNRTPVKNPVGFDRPEFWGQYRDSRDNVFLDGKSNLVLRATKDGDTYFGGLVSGNWRGGIGTTWEARIKLNCLTGGGLAGVVVVQRLPWPRGRSRPARVVRQWGVACGNHRPR